MAPSVKRPTLDFSSSHDLTVCEIRPRVRLYADSVEPAWDTLSLSLSASPPRSLSLKNKYFKKEFNTKYVKEKHDKEENHETLPNKLSTVFLAGENSIKISVCPN